MRSLLAVAVGMALLPCVCFAGPKRDHTDRGDVAMLELPTLNLFGTGAVASTHAEEAAGDAGTMDLPDAPMIPTTRLTFDSTVPVKPVKARTSLTQPKFSAGMSPIYSVPLGATAMRFGGHNFNTNDGSSMDAFAICYRLNKRSSVQVIPGDPAPVKLPVATMANNKGVTVGMVYRLSKRR